MHAETDADPGWVASLAGVPTSAAVGAIEEAAEDRPLFAHLALLHARHGRDSYIEIDAPLELYALVRLRRPRHVVEVGVSSGVSSAYVLEALARNGTGRLHSVDLPQFEGAHRASASWSLPRGCGPGWAVPPRLRPAWDLRLGDKRHVLPILAEQLGAVDLFIYDVPHEDRATRKELSGLDPIFSADGVAVVDHGPGGGACAALRGWARSRKRALLGRRGTGLYAFGARRASAQRGTRGLRRASTSLKAAERPSTTSATPA